MVMLERWSVLQVSREEEEQRGEQRGVACREAQAALFASVHLFFFFMELGQNLVTRLHVTAGGPGEYSAAIYPAQRGEQR